MFTNQCFSDGIEQHDFAVDTFGCFHLRTRQDLALFAVHSALMVAVVFLFAATATLL